jgi:arylsulfatase A-like enzyme
MHTHTVCTYTRTYFPTVGGTHVESFVYSKLLHSDLQGTEYDGIFHVTDWFPTLLDMAGVNYDAPSVSVYPMYGFRLVTLSVCLISD